MSIEAMKQALEIIKNMRSGYGDDYHTGKEWTAMDALRQAIEQAEKQEPVAYRKEAHGMWFYIEKKPSPPNDDYEPLYTAPSRREWVGLTDEEIDKAIISTAPSFKPGDVARAIGAKLRERNT